MKQEERERQMFPIYHQAAEHFADLHDTSGRMKAKGVIRSVLQWPHARNFFISRLKRRLAEENFIAKLRKNEAELSHTDAIQILKSWFIERQKGDWDSDEVEFPKCHISLFRMSILGSILMPTISMKISRRELVRLH